MGTSGVKAQVPSGLPVTPLTNKQVRRITNLHMVTRPGHDKWQITQCIGELSGGDPTIVELPLMTLPRDKTTAHLIGMFKDAGRFGKIMGLFEPGTVTKEW